MKNQRMIQAAILISRLQFQQGILSEAQAVASFVKRVLLPMLSNAENSKEYKEAEKSLIEQGRNAKQWMIEKNVLDRHLKDFLN